MQKHQQQVKFNNYAQTFQQKNIQFNPQQQSKEQSSVQFQLSLKLLGQTQVFLKIRKIKSSYLLLLILLTACTYNKVFNTESYLDITFPESKIDTSVLVLINPTIDTSTFQQFKQKNNKKYSSQGQELYRCLVFKDNQNKINAHNIKKQRTFNQALNQFADLTAQQFALIYTTTFPSNQEVRNYAKSYIEMQQQAMALQNGQRINKEIIPTLNQTQLAQILNLVTKLVQKKHSNLQNQPSFNSLSDFSNIRKSFKNNQTSNLSNNLIYQNQIQNIQNYFQSYIQHFIQRFQDLASQVFGTKIQKKIVSQFLIKNKQTILNALNMSDSLIISTLNQTNARMTQSQISLKFDQILSKIYQKTNLTSSGPLQQIFNISNSRLLQTSSASPITQSTISNTTISIDWTYHAGAVRYQGICGACYTFASSDAVGALYSIYQYGFFIPLSTQQVIDCSSNGLTYGCGGGFLEGSFAYMQVRGITSDYSYPYVSSTNGIAGSCKFQGGNFKISLFKSVTAGSCPALIQQLKYGPVSIGIAGYRLQFYSTGIFNDCNSYIDHAVVLIAYQSGVGWKIKNSWGTTWGINGFGWIADGDNCGICDMAVAPKL